MSLPKDQKQSYEIIIATERVADQIMQNKQELLELDKRRNFNREAIRDLKKGIEKKVWMTVGSIIIEMNYQNAIDLMLKGLDLLVYYVYNINFSIYRSR